MEIKELICASDNVNLNNGKRFIHDGDKLEVNSFIGDKAMILDTYKRRLKSITDLSEQLEFHVPLQVFINDLEKSDVMELTCHIINVNSRSFMLLTDKANEIVIAAIDWKDKIKTIDFE